ncbi:adhesion G protein-coupled receptor B3-like isoform X1 [Ruditapes philippinarum]|uniref:adhesion G protein-coupled receptor B3-like isoform X1 n=1 Tax=Ruditapes philippinarum TaxID=129788 RepID=UPI00295AD8A2|nr:adhesion G protein-coupled receptor B3-like isoform X1 [Ruditapes philippinarum]XP_060561227.1 adhesion G protein-coupled receptor B3-like isoform X1 [Ruditapes philippinarum]
MAYKSGLCLSTGSWSSTSPTCVKEVQTPKTCKENVDSRGLTWSETISGNTKDKRCPSGFTGSISRTCCAGGEWNLPQYNCVRESIVKVNETVSTLSNIATGDEVHTVLQGILKVTIVNETTDNNSTLTDGELSVLSLSLETVAGVLTTSSGIINKNITDAFLEIASNLVDESNQESWKSLSQSENKDELARVLKAVDSLAEILSNSIEVGPENNGTLIVKKNIAIDVKKFSNKDVLFPDPEKTVSDKDDANADWFKQARSSLRLEAAALKNKSVQYATAAVMYRDLSKILPNKRNNTNNNEEDTDDVINAPILSLTISPPLSDKLNPPLQLNFTHDMTNFSNPLCSYWAFPNGNIGQGLWSSEGCIVKTTNTNYTICLCDHLTNFAVLMSPSLKICLCVFKFFNLFYPLMFMTYNFVA